MFYHPQFLGPVHAVVTPLPDDSDAATNITVQWMAEKAAVDSSSELVHAAMRDAVSGGGADSFPGLCRAVHSWVRSHVRFIPDRVPAAGAGQPADTEVLIRPVDLLRMPEPAGDCDCISMLVAAMLLAARAALRLRDLELYFVAVGADGWRPREFSHVYVYAIAHGVVMPIDASHGPVAGWEVQNRFGKKRVWSVDGVSMIARILGGRGPFLAGLGLGQDDGSDFSFTSDVLPGLFKAGEQIAINVTRPAGLIQTTGPGGYSTTYQMPTSGPAAGAPAPLFPSSFAAGPSSLGSWIPLLLIGGLALFVFSGGRR